MSLGTAFRRAAASRMSYRAVVMSDSPSGYWRLGETSGTTAVDEVGGTNFTYSGVTLNQSPLLVGESDRSVYLDGTNGKITGVLPAAATAPYTIETWAKLDSPSPAQHHLGFAWWDGASTYAGGYLRRSATGNFVAYWDTNTSWRESTVSLSLAVVHHVVWVVTSTTVSFYVDGQAAGSGAITAPGGLNVNSTRLGLGCAGDGTSKMKGFLDDCALYPSALSAARIAAHYQAGIGA